VIATVGFDKLATITKKSPKSLMRMLGAKGNPQARNFFEIVAYLQKGRSAFESARDVELTARWIGKSGLEEITRNGIKLVELGKSDTLISHVN